MENSQKLFKFPSTIKQNHLNNVYSWFQVFENNLWAAHIGSVSYLDIFFVNIFVLGGLHESNSIPRYLNCISLFTSFPNTLISRVMRVVVTCWSLLQWYNCEKKPPFISLLTERLAAGLELSTLQTPYELDKFKWNFSVIQLGNQKLGLEFSRYRSNHIIFMYLVEQATLSVFRVYIDLTLELPSSQL